MQRMRHWQRVTGGLLWLGDLGDPALPPHQRIDPPFWLPIQPAQGPGRNDEVGPWVHGCICRGLWDCPGSPCRVRSSLRSNRRLLEDTSICASGPSLPLSAAARNPGGPSRVSSTPYQHSHSATPGIRTEESDRALPAIRCTTTGILYSKNL